MSGAPYPALVMEHARAPRHQGTLPDASHTARCSNPLCGDRVQLDLRIESDRIQAVRQTVKGCALARASASIMTELLEGRPRETALELARSVEKGLGGAPTESNSEGLRALFELRHVSGRRRCVTLAWEALAKALA